jgi:hypothetical protein
MGQRGARGVQALPGRYIARLIANGVTVDQSLSLELDPEVKVSAEDLKAQFEMSRKIAEMQSGVATLLAKSTNGKLTQASEELARPANVGRSEAAPRLRENLDALFNMVDGIDAAPTAAQVRYYDQLQSQYAEIAARVNAR